MNMKSKFYQGLLLGILFLLVIDIMIRLDMKSTIDNCGSMAKALDLNQKSLQIPVAMTAGVPMTPCSPGIPCEYPEEFDLRIIVMTFNRAESLKKLLQSLNDLELDPSRESASLEIWIDRNKSGEVHRDTLLVAHTYQWPKGQTRVHIQKQHVGIYGQWIDTWRPRNGTREVALFLEDDLSVSRYTWKWLKAVRDKYGKDPQCFGYALQSERMLVATSGAPFKHPAHDTVFMYQLVGSWGFSPTPAVWRHFQDWFHGEARADPSFRPYVDGLLMTSWYKKFEKSNTQDSMWTMWFIYYVSQRQLYGVFNNINGVWSTNKASLCVHREEPGLHYRGKARTNAESLLMSKWSADYVKFPKKIKRYKFSGVIAN